MNYAFRLLENLNKIEKERERKCDYEFEITFQAKKERERENSIKQHNLVYQYFS